MGTKKVSIEDNYKKLESILEELKDEESLEKSIKLYIEGKKLIEDSEKQLSEIEKKVSEFKKEQSINQDE